MASDEHKTRSLGKAILLTLPILLLMTQMVTQGQPLPTDPLRRISLAVAYVVTVGVFFLIAYTGRTHKYRAALFVTYAFSFILVFIPHLLEQRGSMSISRAQIIDCNTPFCHMVIPTTTIPVLLSRTVIFPGSFKVTDFASIGTMLVLWLGATLALGRGWCSWGCFYGGLDEGFSKIGRRPLLRRIDRKWTYLPFAILLAVVLTSAATLTPTYCTWLCPFKSVTEFAAVVSATALVQAVIFVSLFLGLVIVLPVLTKRRTQCGLFCPMGAFQSLADKVNIFDIRIDPARCVQCGRCESLCPTFSIDRASIQKGRTRLTCTKCGRCVDACPQGAIAYHIKGTPAGAAARVARWMFLYPAYLLLAVMGSGMIAGAAYRILLLVTTGSILE